MNKYRFAAALLLAGLLAGCAVSPAQTEVTAAQAEATVPETTVVEELSLVVTDSDISQLEAYPDLKRVDLTGSTCYNAIRRYSEAHPEVDVIYTVAIGSREVSPDTQELALLPGECSCEMLLETLVYLPELKSLTLTQTDLSVEQLQEISEAYPEIAFTYTVAIADREIDGYVTELELSDLAPDNVAAAAKAFPMLPRLEKVSFTDAEGSSTLSPEDVAVLMEALPDIEVYYTFELFGKTVSTSDEELAFNRRLTGEDPEGTLRAALKVLRHCKRIQLENSGLSDEILAQIREDFRATTKVVWRIYFAKSGSCMTDRTVLRYVYNLTNDTCKRLKYCEDAEYIDFGHNEFLTDCSWVGEMKNLKAIILSGSMVADLSAFDGLENLEFIELAYCGYLEDISPLSGCSNLKMVNTSFTKVTDFSPLDSLPIEILVSTGSGVTAEEQERIAAVFPEALTQFSGDQPYGYPWRYTQEKEHNEYYGMLREIFDYENGTETYW